MPDRDYSHVPLTAKLGIRPGSRVLIQRPPEGFDALLGAAHGAQMLRRAAPPLDVVLGFATTRRELQTTLRLVGAVSPAGGIWIGWPKLRTIPTELSFDTVQRAGLDAGLVDNKICRIDEIWQAMRFVRRVRDRPPSRVG